MSALPARPLPRLADIQAERARRDLYTYVRQAWHVVEPATPFVDGWHLEAMCRHLQAVTNGDIRQLLINIPPRHAKSLIVSVFWPTWEWITHPSRRWLFSSYALSLSVRDSLKCRRLIESPWYQDRWGDRYQLTGDQNAKLRYDNDATGYRLATSVDSALTGEGGDRLVIDDPHNVREAESDTVRTGVLEWWDQAMSTRLNDPKTGTKVIVMQRVHEADLSGHVLAHGGWEHLCLPMRYEEPEHGTKLVTGIGWSDPRTEDGALLCPERIGEAEALALETTLGSYGAAGQLQQRPAPRGGGLFKRQWWRRYKALPKLRRVAQFMDSAFKTGVSNDPTGIATWAEGDDGDFYVLDYWEEKLAYPDLMRAAHDVHNAHTGHGRLLTLTIEDKASGQSALQTLARPLPQEHGPALPALTVLAFPDAGNRYEREMATLSKIARAEQVTPLVQAGRVWLPEGAPWVEAFVACHERFPSVAHDEPVDTTSMALIRLAGPPVRSAWAA